MASIRKKKGRPSWEARVIIKGHPKLSKSFRKETDAKRWAAAQEAKIRGGGTVSRLPEKITIQKVIDAYLAAHRVKLSEAKAETKAAAEARARKSEAALGKAKPDNRPEIGEGKKYACLAVAHHLGEFTVYTLDRKKIQKFVDQMQETQIPRPANKKKTHKLYDGDRIRTYSPAAVRKHFYALKTAMEWHAVENGYSLGDKFEKLRVPKAWASPRDRRLEKGEEKRILVACDGMYKDPKGWKLLIGLALETAMRTGELLGMRWEEIHLAHRFHAIPKEREKTRKGRQVPLSTKALAILKELRKRNRQGKGRIFDSLPRTSLQLGRGFKRITKRAGCNNLRFHDLRHEATSRFFERTNLQTMEIAMITGHTDLKTLSQYANLRPALLAAKLDGGIPVGEGIR